MVGRMLMFGWLLAVAAGPLAAEATAAAPSAGDISAEFAVPVDRVRQLHEREGLSYEEVRTALILSRETGVSLDEIVGLHRAGVSFEDIAARHRLDLGEVLSTYERERAGRAVEPPERLAVREETDQERARRLAKRHGFLASEVMAVREDGVDWPAVEEILEVAGEIGHSPTEVQKLRAEGLDYDQIRLRLGNRRPAQVRPAWDSPSNPAARDTWLNNDWRLYRGNPGFPPEQLDDRLERPAR